MKYLYLLGLLFIFGCTNTQVQEELNSSKQNLETANEKIKQLEGQIEPEGELVHLVFFKVKQDANQAALVAEVKKLEGIKEVMDLEIGPFEDLGDPRALSDYTMLMQMSFANKAAYERYQKHPIHLALKGNTGAFMAGPPATYDFMKR